MNEATQIPVRGKKKAKTEPVMTRAARRSTDQRSGTGQDAIGRIWQMSTIQVDFQLPQRFDLEYQGPDGTRSARSRSTGLCSGSIERFFAVLLEHYAGAFPAWLAPVTVVGIPVADQHIGHLQGVVDLLRSQGFAQKWTPAPTGCPRRSAMPEAEGPIHADRRR